ncbi:hypothetical protein BDZ97DRAFT_131299 [Flammula alnicola]|nr:hypothetical protein BDZ97DRAFT_131299 [Flammula alnicola]
MEGYLYAVLNLPKYASQTEINERHRSLSLIFHPDKQTDEQLKETAAKKFLEIQKAYQVLSDPFLRQVYDTLGSEGLAMQWPSYIRSRSKDEIQELLEQNKLTLARRNLNQSILPKGKITCQFDASSIFDSETEPIRKRSTWITTMQRRFSEAGVMSRSIIYSAEKKINEKTSISFEGHSTLQRAKGSFRFLGTVRHQFSPRVVVLASLNPFFPFTTKLDIKYEDPDNTLTFKTAFFPLAINSLPVTTTVSLSRRLFRSKPQRAKISLQVSKNPSISFLYISPPTLELSEDGGLPQKSPPTTSGLKYMLFDKSIGLSFDRGVPDLVVEVGLSLVELSTRLKASVHYGLSGLLLSLGVNWSNDAAEVASTLILSPAAVILNFDFGYLEQRLSLPIVLSTQFSPFIALGAVVIPSTATALGYHFFVIPRRRAQRLAHLRAIKKEFEEDSDARKERNAVEALLKDSVKKQIRVETEREGLVIQQATYGAAESEDATENILVDVTIPLQALVRNSQLHIPGGDTKAALQGFSDPAPFASKSLRVRYLFRGRVHYAEIPDYLPVVLPLAEHQVNGYSENHGTPAH